MKFSIKISLFLIGSFFFCSCKKETPIITQESRVTHSWKLRFQGSDINNNGTFDQSEKNMVSDSAAFSYQFKSGGTGFRVGNNSSFIDTLTWYFAGDNGMHIDLKSQGIEQSLDYLYEVGTDEITLTDTAQKPAFFRNFILQ